MILNSFGQKIFAPGHPSIQAKAVTLFLSPVYIKLMCANAVIFVIFYSQNTQKS